MKFTVFVLSNSGLQLLKQTYIRFTLFNFFKLFLLIFYFS